MALTLLREILAARSEILGPSPEAWYDRLEREDTSLEEALGEARAADPLLGLSAAAVLAQYWFHRGRIVAGRRWLGELLEAAPAGPSAERAMALRAAGGLAFRQGDNDVAIGYERAALDMARELGRADIEAEALVGLARTGLRDRNPEAVLAHAGQARAIARQHGGDAIDLSALHCMAEATRMAGRLDEARALYVESLERNRDHGASVMVAVELNNLAFLEKASGRLDVAEQNLRQAITISLESKNAYLLAHHLVAFAAVAAAAGRAEEAAKLLGKAEQLFEQTGLALDPADEPERQAASASARQALGEGAFDAAFAAGQQIDLTAYVAGG